MAQNNFAVQSDKDGNIQWPKSTVEFQSNVIADGINVNQQIKSNTFNPIKSYVPNQPSNESYIDKTYINKFAQVGSASDITFSNDNKTITFNNVIVFGDENTGPATDHTISSDIDSTIITDTHNVKPVYGIKLTNDINMYLGQWVRVKIKCTDLIMPDFYDDAGNYDDSHNLKKEPGKILFYLKLKNDPQNPEDTNSISTGYLDTGKYGPMVLHRQAQHAVSDFKYIIYNKDLTNVKTPLTNTQVFNSYGVIGSYGQIYQMPFMAKIENSQVFTKTAHGDRYIDMYIRLDPTIFQNYSYGSDISDIEIPVQLYMTIVTGKKTYNSNTREVTETGISISGSITIESVETIKSTADFIDAYQLSFGKYASGNTNWANQVQGGEIYAYNRRFVRYEQEYVGDIGETGKNDYTYKSGKSVILPPKLRLDCGVKIPQTGSLTVDAIWMYDNKTGKYRKVTLYDGMLNLADEDEPYYDSNSYGTYRNNFYGSSSEKISTDYNIPNYCIVGKNNGTVKTVKGNWQKKGYIDKDGNIDWRKVEYNYQLPKEPSTE